jgi:hypothetical protein
MLPRRPAALFLVICLSSAMAIFVILHSSPKHPGQAGASLHTAQDATRSGTFAYITERELVVMRRNRVVARVFRVFDEADPAQNKVVWTNDGNYVALLKNVSLLQEPASAEELITVNAYTGDVRHIPCPRCYDLTPIGLTSIMVAANASDNSAKIRFFKFNLDSGAAGLPVNLASSAGAVPGEFFLASTQKYVLTNQGANGHQEELEITRVDDKSRHYLGYFNSNDYMLAAVSEDLNDTSTRIAVAFRPNPGECVAQFPVVVFNTYGGVFDTDMSKAEPSGYTAGINEGLQVNDLWGGADGHFHATITSWTCDNSKRTEGEKQTLASPSTPWRLDGRAWVRDGRTPATMMRQLDRNTRAVLVIPDCVGSKTPPDPFIYCNTGTLYRDEGHGRTLVATKVISISAPSPEYVQRVLSTATPVLGQLAGYFTHGQGFGQVRPSEIYNGGDPTGLVTDVIWKSWGGPRAVATGKAEYLGPNQSPSSGREERATVVAFNLGTCDGERMYQAIEWYFPQHGQNFNPHQYENICTGTYMPNS